MPKLGYQCMFFYGDGYQGLQQLAPFDKIIVTAGATFVPQALKDQLKVGVGWLFRWVTVILKRCY